MDLNFFHYLPVRYILAAFICFAYYIVFTWKMDRLGEPIQSKFQVALFFGGVFLLAGILMFICHAVFHVTN